MEFFERCQERQSAMQFKHLLNFAPLTTQQQKHLVRMYGALLMNVIVTAVGVYVQCKLCALPTFVLLLLQFCCVGGLAGTSPSAHLSRQYLTPMRAGCFGGFGFLSGMLLGEYISFVNSISPAIVPSAFVLSMAIFTSLSAAAIFAKERKFFFLGSILGTMLTCLTYLSLFSLFMPSKLGHDIMLWGGLFLYLGFVLLDTQVTLEMAKRGASDFLMDALQVYADFLGIFIRVLQVLAEREARRKRRRDDE